jgi:DNA repair exonuclease SbcCD ATPase subunit
VVLGPEGADGFEAENGSKPQQQPVLGVQTGMKELLANTPAEPRCITTQGAAASGAAAGAGARKGGNSKDSCKDEYLSDSSISSTKEGRQQGRPQMRTRACIDSSSSSFSESSSSEEDDRDHMLGHRQNRAKQNTKQSALKALQGATARRRANPSSSNKKGKQQRRPMKKGVPFTELGKGSTWEESEAVLAEKAAKLQAESEELQQREAQLADALAKVRPEVLDQDLAALKQLWSEQKQLAVAEEQYEAVAALHGQLVAERYNKLASALRCINEPLAGIYRQLTGGVGDAYCSYTLEKTLLFREGVTLHVRPDHKRWRTFAMLSGGQQALAALALSFALQVRNHYL